MLAEERCWNLQVNFAENGAQNVDSLGITFKLNN